MQLSASIFLQQENMNKRSLLSLLQPHTVEIYGLQDKVYTCTDVNARDLLHVSRFDLFAKLYYARNRTVFATEALDVYVQHIKAFNPDMQEPGREDKVTIEAFISTYDYLLDYFKENDFDASTSLIPVDEDGVILDGAHRVAALAYYGKSVTIVKFQGVKSKGPFDYRYFKERGLSWKICDIIANEMSVWREDILVACLWPKMGNAKCKDAGLGFLSIYYQICYTKDIAVNLKAVEKLVKYVYAGQPWVHHPESVMDKSVNCYGNTNKTLRVVVMQSSLSLDETIANKEALRMKFDSGKHSIHITDNVDESRDILPLFLTQEGLKKWNDESGSRKLMERIKERWFYFKKIELINLKVAIARIVYR